MDAEITPQQIEENTRRNEHASDLKGMNTKLGHKYEKSASTVESYTEHKKSSGFYEAGEERYRALISKMCNGFALLEIICNQNGEPCDGRFREVNPAFEQITGLNADKLIGNRVGDVFPGTESFWVHLCGQIALTGMSDQFKNISKLFDRYFEVVAYSPQKKWVAIVFTDITRRIQVEETLRERESNFAAIAENANDGILIMMGEGGFVYANREANEITGYSIAELHNMTLQDLVHPDEIKRVGQLIKKRLNDGWLPARYETIIVTKNEQTLLIEVAGSRTIWRGQDAVLILFRDITLRKRFEKALGQVNNELECRINERTKELVKVAEELDAKQKELMRHKIDLEKANKELVQTNTALSVLARNIDKKRDEIQKKIARTISSQIMPLIEETMQDNIPEKSRAKLEVLSAYLNDLTPDAAKSHDVIISLSAMELRIAMMIKNGFSSEEISRLLHLSPFTVKTHRRSIRRKLKITNAKINLASYLKLKLGKTANTYMENGF